MPTSQIFRSPANGNAFTGGLIIKAGTATLGSATAASTNVITLGDTTGNNAATLQLYSGTITNPVVLTANANKPTLTIGASVNGTRILTGGVTGTGNLNLTNDGSAILQLTTTPLSHTGNITYVGTSTATANTPLSISCNVNNIGSITNAATSSKAMQISGNIGTTVTAVVQNSATSPLSLTGNNLYSNTVVNAGALTISGTNNLSGSITVNSGTLTVSGFTTNAGNITVNNGGTLFANGTNAVTSSSTGLTLASGGLLGGTGLINLSAANANVTVQAGGKLSPGAATNTAGTLTLALGTGTLDLTGIAGTGTGALVYNLAGAGGTTLVNVASGKVNLGSGLLSLADFIFNGALNANQTNIVLIQSTNISGTLSGGGSTFNGTLPNGWAGTLAIVGGTNLVLTLNSGNLVAQAVTWQGKASASTLWDSLTTNFVATGTATPTNYLDGDTVTFDDTAAQFTVTNTVPVSPAAVIVTNNTSTYTIAATIAGTGSLTKSGTGTLNLNANNTYSGGTTVTNGTLAFSVNSGTSGGVVTSGATGTGNVTLGNSSVNPGSGLTWNAPTLYLINTVNLIGGNRLKVGFNTIDLGNGTRTLNVNGKSLVATNGFTLVSAGEATGQSQWETVAGPSGSNPTIQNGVLDLETTAFSGTNYGAIAFANINGWNNASLIIGTNVLLQMNSNGNINGPAMTINSNGIFDMSKFLQTVASLADGVNGGGAIFGSMLAASTTAVTLTINGTTGTTTFSGTINNGPGTGALSLAKTGTSIQILTGTNTYTGATTISGGTLLVNSPGSLASAVTVNAAGTLGGTGTISNTVTVNAGSFLAPGGGSASLGKLTVTTNVIFNGTNTLNLVLSNALTAGVTYDQLVINGTNRVNGTNYVQLSALSGTVSNGTYTLISYQIQPGTTARML